MPAALGKIRALPVVHADEASWRHDGLNYWVWYAGDEDLAVGGVGALEDLAADAGDHYFILRPLAAKRVEVIQGERFEGALAPDLATLTDAELVERVVRIINAYGRPIASPAEARKILGLKK